MDTSTESTPGLFRSAGRLLNATVSTIENRIELLLLELKEERFRLFDTLLLSCAAAVLGFMALLTATVTIVVIFWDSGLLTALVVLSAIYSLATAGVVWRLRVRLQNWSCFSSTLAELKKDRACWEEEN